MNEFPTTLLLSMVALVIVMVAAWLILRGIASMGKLKNLNGRIKVTESVAVGPKERIVLLEFEGKSLLVGVSAGGLVQIDPKLAVTSTTLQNDANILHANSQQ